MTTVRYQLLTGKVVVAEDGPDDAELQVTADLAAVTADEFDATVAFMRGKLKSTGSTAALFELLKSGDVERQLKQLASRP